MKASYAVVGHHTRRESAEKLAADLGAVLAMDDGGKGSLRNHDDAWRLGLDQGGDFVVVLEDDVQPVPGFEVHVADALAHAPSEGAVSFYTGRTRPMPTRVSRAVHRAEKTGACWITGERSYWGPALALPARLVSPMLDYVSDIDLPYDRRLGRFLQSRRMPCHHTFPSLVEHLDGPSLLSDDTAPRTAHRVGVPNQWNRKTVKL